MERKWVEMERDMAVKGTLEWIDNVADLFERAARETKGYRDRFVEAVNDTAAGKENATKPSEVLSWCVNSVSNPFNNLRLDMAVTHGSRLNEAYSKVKRLAKEEKAAADAVRPKTHMLVGTRTVLPSLRSARAYCDNVRPPTLIHVGTLESCFERAKGLDGGRMNCTVEEWRANNVPVVVTDRWTYHVSSTVASDDWEI